MTPHYALFELLLNHAILCSLGLMKSVLWDEDGRWRIGEGKTSPKEAVETVVGDGSDDSQGFSRRLLCGSGWEE